MIRASPASEKSNFHSSQTLLLFGRLSCLLFPPYFLLPIRISFIFRSGFFSPIFRSLALRPSIRVSFYFNESVELWASIYHALVVFHHTIAVARRLDWFMDGYATRGALVPNSTLPLYRWRRVGFQSMRHEKMCQRVVTCFMCRFIRIPGVF